MKIGLITIHYANSYGGTLQAYSTQQVLARYGEVKIIDYRSPGLSKTMSLVRAGVRPRDVLRMGKDLFRLFPRYRLLKKFRAFAQRHYRLTATCCDLASLARLESDFDCFVTGSDQIWNPAVVESFDSAYFLSFVKGERRKISFASSAGSHRFSELERQTVREHLGSFAHLAVREADTAACISELLEGRSVTHVLDPTLMLTREEWLGHLGLERQEAAQPYVLVYTLKKDDLVKQAVTRVAQRLNLRIVAIDQDPFLPYHAHRHIRDASPVDFVSLIGNAAFVITNSFHGTAFAVNFQIPFVSIKPESGLNRIAGFLDSVGLRDRLVLQLSDVEQVVAAAPDFAAAHRSLAALRQSSYRYLDQALA